MRKPKKNKAKRVLIYDEIGLKLLAKKLKEVRTKKGYTQEELAYKAEITLSQIARIETAVTNPTVSTIFCLAKALEINTAELFDFRL
ncbi:MAG: helix-turn-helix transcriptional regulator [Bacteroidetes bacterium]|nr:helix-turn-helix transcriptional regulator [Bacteroidota bacterium]MCA6444192.1 helix-turn-helix transcriptional regulator [Bacteroidota bacterium]